MDYYNEIKNKLIDDEVYSKVKDYSKEKHKVITYFEIGKLLYEAGNVYGENIIGHYSKKLMIDVGKKYDKSTLFKMRKFYLVFSDEKVAPLVPQLFWSHYLMLLPIKDKNEINYYINQALLRNLTKRQLQDAIKSKEYQRLPKETKYKLTTETEIKVQDLIREPIIIKNNKNYEIVSEKILQKLILEDIQTFLKELGSGFAFIGNEYKIKVGGTYNYIDLLLFNYQYNCFVVVELKVTKLKKEHIGQIEVYMNYIDKNLRNRAQDKTIGIIICKTNNNYVIEYCSDKRIIAKEYELI